MLMRFSFLTNGFVCLLLLLVGQASAEEPRAILDRAIPAHGGADRLERTKKGHLKAKSEGNQSNVPFRLEIEEWFDLPSRYKRIKTGSINEKPFHREDASTEKEGWAREGTGPISTFSVHQPMFVTEHWHAVLASLLLLRDKDVQFKSLPDETKDGRTLVGFHATSQQVNGDFFFDKSTGLLAKTQQTRQNPLGGQEVIADTSYDEYRDVQGIQYPMRFKSTAGKTYSTTITLSSLSFGGKIDESNFTKPKTPSAEPSSENDEKTQTPRDRMLIVATVGAGAVVGAVWFLVRASKRGKREAPPS
jgi:hypothetical protein